MACAVVVAPCADDVNPDGFDGVIIGSAIYTRRWIKAATRDSSNVTPTDWTRRAPGCSTAAHAAREPGEEQVATLKAIARVIVPLGLPAPVTFGGRLDTEHATGPAEQMDGREGTALGRLSGPGANLVVGRLTLHTSSIRQLRKGSSDGGGAIHRRRADERVSSDQLRPVARSCCRSQSVGRIAWQAADGPQILPVTYAWHEGTIIFGPRPTACCLSWSGQPTSRWRSMSLIRTAARGMERGGAGPRPGSCRTRSARTHVDSWRRRSVGCRREERLYPGHSAPRNRSGGGGTVRLSLDMRKSGPTSTSVMMITAETGCAMGL